MRQTLTRTLSRSHAALALVSPFQRMEDDKWFVRMAASKVLNRMDPKELAKHVAKETPAIAYGFDATPPKSISPTGQGMKLLGDNLFTPGKTPASTPGATPAPPPGGSSLAPKQLFQSSEPPPQEPLPDPKSLPKGWRAARHPDGRIYYFHKKTKSTQWSRPQETPVAPAVPVASAAAAPVSSAEAAAKAATDEYDHIDDQTKDAIREEFDIFSASAGRYRRGQRLMMVHDGSLVDGVLLESAKKDLNLCELQSDLCVRSASGESRRVRKALYPCGVAQQRLESVAAFEVEMREYLGNELTQFRWLEDGITGKKLDIETMLAFISTKSDSGPTSGTFLDEQGQHVTNGSIVTLTL